MLLAPAPCRVAVNLQHKQIAGNETTSSKFNSLNDKDQSPFTTLHRSLSGISTVEYHIKVPSIDPAS